jgi:hypothetical protein
MLIVITTRTLTDGSPVHDVTLHGDTFPRDGSVTLPVVGGRGAALELAENLKRLIEFATTETVEVEE